MTKRRIRASQADERVAVRTLDRLARRELESTNAGWMVLAQYAVEGEQRTRAVRVSRVLQLLSEAIKSGDDLSLVALETVARQRLRASENRDQFLTRVEWMDEILDWLGDVIERSTPADLAEPLCRKLFWPGSATWLSLRGRGFTEPSPAQIQAVGARFTKLAAGGKFDVELWLSAALNELGFRKRERERFLSYLKSRKS